MRINEFKTVLDEKKSDFALFYNSDSNKVNPNMLYFSGYRGLGALTFPRKKAPFLIVPDMEFQRAKKSMIKRVYPMEKKRFFESIYKIIKEHHLKAKNIAIDKNNFTLNSYKHFKKHFKKIKVNDISLECLKLRTIKTEKEIQLLKKSCSYADKILQKLIKDFRSFKTESEASALLEYETKKNGL